MKIVFIVPAADIRRTILHRFISYVYGPTNAVTGPLILGGILKRAGHDVEVYQELDQHVNLNKIKGADIVGLYTMTSNVVRAYEIADYFKKTFNSRILIGGIHASAMPEEALAHADQVVVGEAESVILNVVEKRIKNKIIYAPIIQDLDTIPFPDYSVLKTPCGAANILTTRGCLNKCTFCTTSRMFAPYRQRSVENVIEEIALYKKMGFKYVNFQDDNLTADKERIKEILRRMIADKLIFKNSFFFGRHDLAFDDELLELLRDAQLRRVLIGYESLNQASLDLVNKKQRVDDILKIGDKLSKYKIKIMASIVIGLDTDTIEDIRKAVDFSIAINSYQLQPAIITPYPGTEVYRQFEAEGRIYERGWQYYDMMNVVFLPKNLTMWELQKEFFYSIHRFFSFSSIFRMYKLFGLDAAIRTFGIWMTFSGIMHYFHIKSLIKNGNIFNRQKEFDGRDHPAAHISKH